MTFKHCNKKNNKWELTRYATDFNYRLPGVATKLFNFFIKHNKVDEVKSFLDKCWLHKENNLYIKLGFVKKCETKPDYSYILKNTIKRKHKFNFRKQKLSKKYNLPLTMTETEMCEKIGAYKIYNCGLIKYIWKNDTI